LTQAGGLISAAPFLFLVGLAGRPFWLWSHWRCLGWAEGCMIAIVCLYSASSRGRSSGRPAMGCSIAPVASREGPQQRRPEPRSRPWDWAGRFSSQACCFSFPHSCFFDWGQGVEPCRLQKMHDDRLKSSTGSRCSRPTRRGSEFQKIGF